MDVNTLLVTTLAVSIVLSLVVASVAKLHPSSGIRRGAAAIGSIAVGIFILACWPLLGTQTSVLLGYTVIAAGLGLSSEALLEYQGQRMSRWKIWSPIALLVVFLILYIEDIQTRTILNALITGVQVLILLIIIFKGRKKTPGLGSNLIAAAAVTYGGGIMFRGFAMLYKESLVESLLSPSWVLSMTYLLSLNGLVLIAVGLVVLSLEQTSAHLVRKKDQLRTYIENTHDVIYQLNLNGEFEYLSPKIEHSLGFEVNQVIGRHFSWILHPDDVLACQALFTRLISTMQPEAGLEYRVRHRNQGWLWHDTNATPLFDNDGNVCGILGFGRDINERKINQNQLEQFAHRDALTGLYNRRAIIDRCDLELTRAKNNGSNLGLLFIDLDEFKNMNDCHGHNFGDAVLKVVAEILSGAVRSSDVIGRLGGDEFLIVLPDFDIDQSIIELAERISDGFSKPIKVDTRSISIGCSICIAIYPKHDVDVNALIHLADQAMYNGKRSGGGNINFA